MIYCLKYSKSFKNKGEGRRDINRALKKNFSSKTEALFTLQKKMGPNP